ncbi:hypothetical protein AVEN_2932-1 [Araneus ventricosus]|uniref:KRAB-related domain-containing protein n=1 Tax=Araneus ventricosus TaxID=182803 RepID=A0A4Y2RMF8_ARAVE|nr:hypothetical protein AVEN_2932-1 [Araneus ventricosus]
MDDKSISNNNVEQYFTADAWTALSEYEKRRFENVLKKKDILKSSGNEDPKADFKLFAVPNPVHSKRMISNRGAGATSDISMVVETNSPSSKTMTRTIINFRGVKPKEFGKNILNSAQNSLKLLEDLFKDLDLNNILDDEDEHLSQPGCSKNIPKRRYSKRNIAKKSCKEEDHVKDEDDFLDVPIGNSHMVQRQDCLASIVVVSGIALADP